MQEGLIVHLGPGMDSDSGLSICEIVATHPVYIENGLTYENLCDPEWISNDPEIFYGFLGECFNRCRSSKPHEGYTILKQRREKYFNPDKTAAMQRFDGWTSTFALASWNVEGQEQKAGIPEEEVDEFCGNIEFWQCSVECCKEVWKAPDNFEFEVDQRTMKAPNKETPSGIRGFESNHPTCIFCGKLARPAVHMFADDKWINPQVRKNLDHPQYAHLQGKKLRLTTLEIGSSTKGKGILMLRRMTEDYATNGERKVSLIRVSLQDSSFPRQFDGDLKKKCTSIEMGGLEALKELDKLMRKSRK
jgi:NAD-dependent SIR2 family protein deacetylase